MYLEHPNLNIVNSTTDRKHLTTHLFLLSAYEMAKGRHIINLVNEETETTCSFSSLDIPDVTLACSDGRLTVDLPTLGLLFPQLAQLLPVFLQAPLAVLLPQHTLGELVTRLQEVTGGAVGLELGGLEEVKEETSLDRVEDMDINQDYQDDFCADGDKYLEVDHRSMNCLDTKEVSPFLVNNEVHIDAHIEEESL